MRSTIDVAGAAIGGAARFLRELDLYTQREVSPHVNVIGRGHQLTPGWLFTREWAIPHGTSAIAANNASFVRAGRRRVTLLRNALHFSTPEEWKSIGFIPGGHMRRQIPVIRALARRSDVLVVPSSAMAERVASTLPQLRDRIVVRHHPVSRPTWASQPSTERSILVPVVPGSHKPLEELVGSLAGAVQSLVSADVTITVTADPEAAPALLLWSQIRFSGVLDSVDLDAYWAACSAVYFPTSLESFGYPLAEARAGGRPIIALDTAQNREIAGPALHGFAGDSGRPLAEAVESALSAVTEPDPAPFDPVEYFDWLLNV